MAGNNTKEIDKDQLLKKRNRYSILGGITFGIFVFALIDLVSIIVTNEESSLAFPIVGIGIGLIFIPMLIQYFSINSKVRKLGDK